jgi:hypothetical protein
MLTLTWSFKYVQLLTWHCTLMYLNCGCVSFCNTKTTVTFLKAMSPRHWSTLLLHVADWYMGCIYRVSTAQFNTLSKHRCKAFVRYHIGAFAWQLFAQNSNKYHIFWVRVCSLCYPACKAHIFFVLYCRPWSVWRHSIFPHNFINGTNFGKYLLKKKRVFWISLIWKCSHSEKNLAKYDHKCAYAFM